MSVLVFGLGLGSVLVLVLGLVLGLVLVLVLGLVLRFNPNKMQTLGRDMALRRPESV